MTTFTWKYGMNQLLFKENFNEHNYRNDDFESENELVQPSEYLFDIHLSKLMKNTISKNEYNITNKVINLRYDLVQKYLAYNKGLLVEIDRTTQAEINENDLRYEIFQFIDYCRHIWRSGGSFNVIREEFPHLFDVNSPYLYEVINIENYFYNNSHQSQPYYLYEKLVRGISPLMKERRQLVRMIKYISPYSSHSDNALTCQIILVDREYDSFINNARELIISDTTETINSYLASTAIDEEHFRNSVNHMLVCIDSCDRGGNHNFGRYRGRKKGCFSVFDINTDEYVSLSGPFDITDKTIDTYFGFDSDKKRSNSELLNRVKQIILADSFFKNSKYANLNLKTERYPYTNGPSIPSLGETVQDAIKRSINSNEIQSDYSCCERKIFSFIPDNVLGQCYMFARHKPCPKCCPAIKKFLQIAGRQMKIFYYDNDQVKEFDMSSI
jgi:hypothetical protein